MTIDQLTNCVHSMIQAYGWVTVGDEEMRLAFSQRGRCTAFGSAVMDMAGLPNETETMERWANAQGFICEPDPMRGNWRITAVSAPASPDPPRP